MNKIKNILISITLFCFAPLLTNALSGNPKIECDTTSLTAGATTNCRVGVVLTEGGINGFSASLTASGGIEIVSTSLSSGWEGTPSNTRIDTYAGQDFNGNVTVATVVIKMKNNATSNGTLAINGVSVSDTNYEEKSLGNKSVNINLYVPKTTNDLTSLSVSDCTLNPAFSSNVTSYTCPDTEKASVYVSAEHNGTKISGTGNKSLKYGPNTLTITVTAESGATKKYTIKINRLDNRDGTATLSSLKISNVDIIFDSNVYEYHVNVPYSVENITISATPTSNTSKVNGVGDYTISEGLNTFKVNVVAENGDTRTYTINITKAGKGNTPSTTLTKLTYNGKEITLVKDVYTYVVGVESTVDLLQLAYETISSTTEYEIDGELYLKDGTQSITIRVTDTGETTKDYKLIVYKAPRNLKNITTLEELTNLNNSSIINIHKNKDHIINKNIFELLKDNRSTITYNVVNDYNGLLYGITLSKNATYDENLNLFLVKSQESPLTYTTNIPANIDVTLFIDNESLNNKTLHLYSYNKEKNSYTLINDKVEVKNQYIKFTSSGSNEYVLSETAIKNEIEASNKPLILCIIFFVSGFIIAYISILLLKAVYKNKKKKELSKTTTLPAIEENKEVEVQPITKEVKEESKEEPKEVPSIAEQMITKEEPISSIPEPITNTIEENVVIENIDNSFTEPTIDNFNQDFNPLMEDVFPYNETIEPIDPIVTTDIAELADINLNEKIEAKEEEIIPLTPFKEVTDETTFIPKLDEDTFFDLPIIN